MELSQLRMFAATAELGSFSRAAGEMYVSHSCVSRAVSALEREFGVKLLERDNKVIGLTEAGRLLLERSRELLRIADDTEALMKSLSDKE